MSDRGPTASLGLVALTLIALSLLSACSRKYEPVLDVSQAQLTTPRGTFELDVFKPSSCWWPVGFEGTDEESLSVMFSPFPPCDLLYVGRGEVHAGADGRFYATDVVATGVRIDVASSWYQRNNSGRYSLALGSEQKYPNAAIFDYTPPTVLEPFHLALIGGGLYSDVADRVQSHRRDRHRFHIAFTVDDEPHSIELEFRLQAEGHWTVGVPGMP